MLYQGAGASFDSQVVEAFLQAADQFREIPQKYIDGPDNE